MRLTAQKVHLARHGVNTAVCTTRARAHTCHFMMYPEERRIDIASAFARMFQADEPPDLGSLGMKKLFSVFVLPGLLLSALVAAAFAHGGGCRKDSPRGQCCHAGSQPLHCHEKNLLGVPALQPADQVRPAPGTGRTQPRSGAARCLPVVRPAPGTGRTQPHKGGRVQSRVV